MISMQYAAGFFDGEGSITVHLYWPKSSDLPTPHVRVAISNYIKLPIFMIKARWGGSTHIGKGDVWGLDLNGADARKFLQDVYPYLIVKREAAAAALELYDHIDDPKMRIRLAKKIMDATRKGYRATRTEATYKTICKYVEMLDDRAAYVFDT